MWGRGLDGSCATEVGAGCVSGGSGGLLRCGERAAGAFEGGWWTARG